MCISYGRLEHTQEAPLPIEESRAVTGVRISPRQAAPQNGAEARGAEHAREADSGTPSGVTPSGVTPLDSVVFTPEREQLPTLELRGACARYDAAFANPTPRALTLALTPTLSLGLTPTPTLALALALTLA